jgi:HSP20 family molecular chaperone IbpA
MVNAAESVSKYRMARAAIDMGDFSVAEIMALADVPEGTAAHFISTLTGNHLVQTVSLPSQGKGRPRNSYQLVEAGRKSLRNYMHHVRLRTEGNKMPFPEASPPQEEEMFAQPVMALAAPYFKGYPLGSRYVLVGAVPGLSAKDVIVLPKGHHVTVQGSNSVSVLPSWANKAIGLFRETFSRDVDLPTDFANPVVLRQVVRNGILTVELGKATEAVGTIALAKAAARK